MNGTGFRLNKWQIRVLKLIGSAALIVGILWFIPFADVVREMRAVKLGYVAAGYALSFVVNAVESYQLWILLKRLGLSIGLWSVFETKMITGFYGQFLPGEVMSSAVKLYRLAGPTKRWGEVLAALAFVRLMNALTLVLIGLVFWAIEMPAGAGRWVGVALIGMAAVLVMIQLLLTSHQVRQRTGQLFSTRALGWLTGRLADRTKALSQTVVASYRLFGDMTWSTSCLAVLRHALGIVGFACFALSLDVHLSVLTIGWIRVVLQAVMMLPISLSGIGLREGSLVILLQDYSVPASQAVALAFLIFLTRVVANSMGGLLELRNFARFGSRAAAVRTEAE